MLGIRSLVSESSHYEQYIGNLIDQINNLFSLLTLSHSSNSGFLQQSSDETEPNENDQHDELNLRNFSSQCKENLESINFESFGDDLYHLDVTLSHDATF
jgi:hypothetical protein